MMRLIPGLKKKIYFMKTSARCCDRVLPLAPPLSARTHAGAVNASHRVLEFRDRGRPSPEGGSL